MSLSPLISEKRILVCVGAGGVGKTTCSAALGLEAAQRGRKTMVLTIDPARRLASSMGLDSIDHVERPVEAERFRAAGLDPAPLHISMLDVRRTFDELVARLAPDAEARARLQRNKLYKEITTKLAGSHEYAAMEKLRAIDEKNEYDLLVLDTPPSRNALDFFEAPRRVSDAVESPAVQWMIHAGGASARSLGIGGTFVLRRLARFLGNRFLEDIGAFLAELNALLGGFKQRAREVEARFRDSDVAFVLVTSPSPTAVDEAIFFADRLRRSGVAIGGVALNRAHPKASVQWSDALGHEVLATSKASGTPEQQSQTTRSFRSAFDEFERMAESDRMQLGRLRQECGDVPHVSVPLFVQDVHDLGGLSRVAKHLVEPSDTLENGKRRA